MFLLNKEIELNWILRASIYDIPLESLDITIKPPKGKGVVSYINNAIGVDDYIPHTTTSDGYVSYKFTPNLTGLWVIVLTNGENNLNSIYYERKIQVNTNDITVNKTVDMVNF